MDPSVGVRILLCLLTSLASLVHLADPQTSFAKFVIIGQHSQFDNLKTAALKDSLSQQIESSGESVEVIVPHVDFPDIAGYWNTWTLFSRISSLARSEWYVFLEEESHVDVSTLFSFLKGFKSTEKVFLGHALFDRSPTIIHHFFGHEERDMILYPDFATGFVLSDALLTSLAIAMNTTAAKATDAFTIDPKHELARLILKEGKTILRSHPDRFCSRKMTGCAISFEETKCAVEPGIKPQDIYVGVKTFSEYHTTRIPVIKRTWSAALPSIEYFSDLVNNVIPTIDSGIPNTERGHCGKTFVILKRFVKLLDDGAKFSWLLISDDDTLISIPRLLRLLSCHDNSEKIIIGERYGYGFSSFGATGYDYPTGGAGMVFSPSAARTIVSKCACPSDDAPDDMIIGMCSMRFKVAIIHNAAFHQARPIDYPEEYIQRISPISFHKFDEIDPYEVYMEYLFEPAAAHRKTEL
uniref:N-acetylgalactosaminide beta-1,3-galactosyltransferase n=1 Tax=Haemonchus contortus TaxID=6289 RepID=A0A7I4YXG7_HAECO